MQMGVDSNVRINLCKRTECVVFCLVVGGDAQRKSQVLERDRES